MKKHVLNVKARLEFEKDFFKLNIYFFFFERTMQLKILSL